jgi:hypothetical protein
MFSRAAPCPEIGERGPARGHSPRSVLRTNISALPSTCLCLSCQPCLPLFHPWQARFCLLFAWNSGVFPCLPATRQGISGSGGTTCNLAFLLVNISILTNRTSLFSFALRSLFQFLSRLALLPFPLHVLQFALNLCTLHRCIIAPTLSPLHCLHWKQCGATMQ